MTTATMAATAALPALALAGAGHASGGGMFVGVGDLPGGDHFSRPYDISADGSVVVGSAHSRNGTTGELGCCEAFRWSVETGIVGLGDLPDTPFESIACGVSADGAVVTGRGHVGVTLGFVHDGSMQAVPELPGGGLGGATARDISADARWIVGWDNAENGTEAFRYDRTTGAIIGLGDLPGGIFRSNAEAISTDGLVVVGSSRAELGTEAFAWTAGTGMVSLGELEGGSHLSIAYALSADGSVIVGYSRSANGDEAFAVTGRTMIPLGDLEGGDFASRAWAVADDGSTIGGYGTSAVGREAVLWLDGAVTPVRVRDVLESGGVEVGAWFLDDVAAISADGTTLTGFGTNPRGEREAWVAVLPATCASDLDGDGGVGVGDLLLLLAAWGMPGHAADLDGDGVVGVGDLLFLLAAWGPC